MEREGKGKDKLTIEKGGDGWWRRDTLSAVQIKIIRKKVPLSI